MRILLLPSYFMPEIMSSSHLNENKYQAFADSGIQMVCYTPQPTRGIDDKTRQEFASRKFERLYGGMMEVHRFPLMKEDKSSLKRAFRYVLCAIIQFYKGISEKQIELLYLGSTPPIQGAMGALIKKIKKIPFVYNLQDIFPDSLVGTGLARPNSFLWRIGRIIEDFTYRSADKIIVISEDFKKNIMAKGVPENKIEVIYNWVDDTAVQPIERSKNPLFEELELDRSAFYVVYAGNLGHAQNVQVLLESAQILKEEKQIRFLIFGTGGLKEQYVEFVNRQNLDNVIFYPLQPASKISQVYSLADLSLVSCKKGLGSCAMPSKTWSILSAGTAVVCSFDKGGDLQHIIENNKLGLFSEADNSQELADNILFLSRNINLCHEFGLNGRKYVEANLTKEIGISKYVDVLKQFKK